MSIKEKDPYLYKKSYKKYEARNMFEKLKIEDVLKLPIIEDKKHSISETAAKYFGIRSSCNTETGKIDKTYFPYYTNGKISGFKVRDWTLDKGEKGHYSIVGSVSINSELFGQNCFKGAKRKLVIFEGERDLCAALDASVIELKKIVESPLSTTSNKQWASSVLKGIKNKMNGVFDDKSPILPYVSLTLGCGNAENNIAHNELFIRGFEKVVLALDNDEATVLEKRKGNIIKGVEATKRVADFLLTYSELSKNNIKEVYTFNYPNHPNDPTGVKDIRDMYEAGMSSTIWRELSYPTTTYTPDKIADSTSLTVEEMIEDKSQGVPIIGLPVLTKMIGGICNTVMTLTAPPGAGKTTLVKKLLYSYYKYLTDDSIEEIVGHPKESRIGAIMLEETMDETYKYLLAQIYNFPPKDFVKNPLGFMTKEEFVVAKQKLDNDDKLKVLDHFGSLTTKDLLNKITQLYFLYKCKVIFLDHLSMVISGQQNDNERKELDIIMTELAAFSKRYGVAIIIVSHIKKKDLVIKKNSNDIIIPSWQDIGMEDLRGSGAMAQLSWVVVYIENEIAPEKRRGRIRIVVCKNRDYKHTGVSETLFMTKEEKFVDASDWYWDHDGVDKDGKKKLYFANKFTLKTKENREVNIKHFTLDTNSGYNIKDGYEQVDASTFIVEDVEEVDDEFDF